MTLDGRLFMHVRPASYDAEAVVGALRVSSYARCAGKIVLIWDGSPNHRANVLKDFRQQRRSQTAGIWSNCPAMPLTSTPMRASGITEKPG